MSLLLPLRPARVPSDLPDSGNRFPTLGDGVAASRPGELS
jgi:hypothetical protein